MNAKRVFVSGGAGVIGRETVARLVARGARTLVGDLKPRPAEFPDCVAYRQGDLNELTYGELAAFRPDTVIHLAATFERSEETWEFWDENDWHNVRLSHRLASLIRDLPSLRRVVFASSYLIYDPALYQFERPPELPVALRETDGIRPRNLTGMAKLAHEIELSFLDRFRSASFQSVCARIFRGYGKGSRDVISRWVRSLLAGEPISVYQPEGRFDYIYSADSAEGLVRLAEAEGVSGVVNLGTGRARSVSEVLGLLRDLFPNMRVTEVPADIPFEASQADMTLYERCAGWTPAYTLETALPEIVAYERAAQGVASSAAPEACRVLVSSASAKTPLVRAVKEAVQRIGSGGGVTAGDSDPLAPAGMAADDFWVMPPTEDAHCEALLAECRRRGIGAIWPTRDGELLFWARHRELFRSHGIRVVVSDESAVLLCRDKLAFARFGRDAGLPFIPAAETPEEAGPPPYVVKERQGAGSRDIGLRLDERSARAYARRLREPIYQPFVEGHEISVDAWLDRNARAKGVVLRTRDRVVHGESRVTTTFRDEALEARCAAIAERLGLRGPVVLQLILDCQNQPHVIECNPRFGGASTASIAVGLDLVYWSLIEACAGNPDALPFRRLAAEVRQTRVPQDTLSFLPTE